MFATDSALTERKRTRMSLAMALLVGAGLVACSPTPDPAQDAVDPVATDTARGVAAQGDDTQATDDVAAPAPDGERDVETNGDTTGDTIGGDGSEIRLDALAGQDITDAALSGELSCSFSVDDAPPLLFATGFVASNEPAQGIVKVAGYVEPIRAPGGFDGIIENPTFTGQGKTITIASTGPAVGGGESPPQPATLTYQRADGASRSFDGRWQCGP